MSNETEAGDDAPPTHLIPENTTIAARAASWDLDTTGTGSTRVRVLFALLGEYKGRHLTYDGYFTDGTLARTVESLRYMGWEGADLDKLEGLDKNEVQLLIGTEEYEGKWRNRVRFVNRAASLHLTNPLDPAAKVAFAQSMKGRILALEQGKPKNGPPTKAAPKPTPGAPAAAGPDDLPF